MGGQPGIERGFGGLPVGFDDQGLGGGHLGGDGLRRGRGRGDGRSRRDLRFLVLSGILGEAGG